MEKLIGQEIRCRIIKLDVADEDVVVDRRAVLEEEERAAKDRRYSEVKEGEIVKGTVIEVRPKEVLVDIGYKSEAQSPQLSSTTSKRSRSVTKSMS